MESSKRKAKYWTWRAARPASKMGSPENDPFPRVSGDEPGDNDLPEVSSDAELAALQRATKQPNGLKKLMHSKNRPALLVMGGGIFLAGSVLLYVYLQGNGAAHQEAKASAGNAPTVRFHAGGQSNAAYANAYGKQQRQNQEVALHNGQSSAPGFVDQQKTSSILVKSAPTTTPNTATATASSSAPTKTVIIETVAPTSSAVVQQEAAMQKYQIVEMKVLMGKWSTSGPIAVDYAPPPTGTSPSGSIDAVNQSTSASPKKVSSHAGEPPAIGSGNLYYSVADTSMDSDQPGPVLATLENGPLKGAHLLGKFANTHNRLIIEFQTATMPNNATVAIDAVAVNPHTNRTALATSVDHHYLERYGLLIGGAFLQGFGQAVMTSGQTTIGGYGGVSSSVSPRSLAQNAEASLGQVGQTVGQIGTQAFNTIQPTVRVAMGTGMGILFLKPVKASALTSALMGQSQQIAASTMDETPLKASPKIPAAQLKLAPPPALSNTASLVP